MDNGPYHSVEQCETPWGQVLDAEGATASERYLVHLARRAFLSLWSYPNVYTDEGRRDSGHGKELCDLLVVFGDDVLLFSDKHCQFIPHEDPNVAWSRWYRRAIEKSAKQLAGAEAWLKRFPNRLYLDPGCKTPLPIKLPEPSRRRVHLVAVTRGSAEASREYWGNGSSGTLMINTKLTLRDHYTSPFQIGWVLPNRRFVHILDETTLDVVLQELDTISDFVTYLRKKQEWMTTPGIDFVIPGEEELVASYLVRFDQEKQEHFFFDVPNGALVVLREGDWTTLLASKRYRNRRKANEISYLWDELIEYQNAHIIAGSAGVLHGKPSVELYERVMRMMAEESRLTRRTLGESIERVRRVYKRDKRFTRTVVSGPGKDRAYVLLSLPQPSDLDYDAYRALRQEQLLMYCWGCKLKFGHVREIIGIAFEPAKAKTFSVDYLAISCNEDPLDPEFSEELHQKLVQANMWSPEKLKTGVIRHTPLPVSSPRLASLIRRIGVITKQVFR